MKIIAVIIFSVLLFSCGNSENSNKHHSPTMMGPTLTYADSINNGIIKEDTMKGSPHRIEMKTIRGNHIHIEYSSPGVKGRVIWGGLVAWDKVWVAGAHHATTVQFGRDVKIGTKKVKEGVYGLFAIPGREKWVFILNSNHDQHLTDEYKESEDVVRIEVKPEAHSYTPRLTYKISKTGDGEGTIELMWENVKAGFQFKNI